MKTSQLVVFVLACVIASCGEPTKTAVPGAETSPAPVEECYAFASEGDTVNLRMTVSGTTVSGTLDHNLDAKDRNKGTISGQMKGDTLFADYRFSSEGVESVREIVFLKKNGTVSEGYGEMEDKEGKMRFLRKGPLEFTNGLILQKVDCGK